MKNPQVYFLMIDQPICPYCSARTETIGDFYHTKLLMLVQQCYNPSCKSIFMEVEDEE